MTPSDKAEIANLKVILRAIELGGAVSKPMTEGTRYDLILDYQGKLYRVQVKYTDGVSHSGAIAVRLHSGSYGKTRFRCYSAEEVDLVLVYVPKLDVILWIGPELFAGKSGPNFRAEKTKNNQTRRCRELNDYIW